METTGVAVALVVDNQDPDGTGRVRVRYPWHSRPDESFWARLAVPVAGDRAGFYFLPGVNDEVLVAFEQGDLKRPCVIGALWSASSRPPVAKGDGGGVRRLRTRSGHALTFDDGARGRVQLELRDGKRLAIDAGGVRLNDEHGNGITIDAADGSVTIRASGRLGISASQVAIESAGTIDIKAGATLTLRGSHVAIN